jgi:hypothetical protein
MYTSPLKGKPDAPIILLNQTVVEKLFKNKKFTINDITKMENELGLAIGGILSTEGDSLLSLIDSDDMDVYRYLVNIIGISPAHRNLKNQSPLETMELNSTEKIKFFISELQVDPTCQPGEKNIVFRVVDYVLDSSNKSRFRVDTYMYYWLLQHGVDKNHQYLGESGYQTIAEYVDETLFMMEHHMSQLAREMMRNMSNDDLDNLFLKLSKDTD